jgi:uncharacterized alpha-E superfamily protein
MLSRVAECLYWMSRYIERAENNARILDVNLQLMLDFENQSEEAVRQHWAPIINSLEEHELFHKLHKQADEESVVNFVTFEKKNPNSIYSCLCRARENARSVREQISSEMWEQINRLYLFIGSEEAHELFRSSAYQFYKRIMEGSFQFIGLTDATMTHGEGWDFCQLGKHIERADRTSRILDIKYHILLPSGERVGGTIDTIQWMAVLRSCSGLEAYSKLYVGSIAPWKVAEFIILNDRFPRALRYSVHRLDAALHRISGVPDERYSNEAERRSGQLRSDLDYSSISEIFQAGLHQYLDRLQLRLSQISDALSEAYCQDAAQWQKQQSQSQSQSQSGGGGWQSQSQSQTQTMR